MANKRRKSREREPPPFAPRKAEICFAVAAMPTSNNFCPQSGRCRGQSGRDSDITEDLTNNRHCKLRQDQYTVPLPRIRPGIDEFDKVTDLATYQATKNEHMEFLGRRTDGRRRSAASVARLLWKTGWWNGTEVRDNELENQR
jgi:hypothetical protein